MGDPAGIGPEVIVSALCRPQLRRSARFVIYGLNEILTYAADMIEADPYWSRVQHDSERAQRSITDNVVVLDYDEFDGMLTTRPGPSKKGGLSSKRFVEDAIADALRPDDSPRHIDALVTGPISKHSWHIAGFKWPGHTELLAHRTRAKRHVMMFTSPRLRVALATTHEPIVRLRDALTIGSVYDAIELGHEACLMLGIKRPRIAVTGLNPHAGEQGAFGDEETRIIEPALEMARNNEINCTGPFPGDTIFIDAVAGRYDLVVAMYHDQGLIPIKLLGWENAVNWTLGLPIIRTSPDHGTAFNIAGKGQANEQSMIAAIELAIKLTRHKPE